MRPLRCLAPLVVAMFAACAGEAPVVSKNPTHGFSVDAGGRRLVEVKLYVTDDEAKTWTLAQDLPVAADAHDAPRLGWSAPHDGEYGFIISSAYADRQVDPAPRAGQEPAVRLVIDTKPPRIARFTAAPAGATAVALAWQVDEPHPGAIRVESSDDGATWATLATLDRAAGDAPSLAIPGQPRRALALRLVATDAAGNETIGDAVAVAFADDAFATAVRDLPTLEPAAPTTAPTVAAAPSAATAMSEPTPTPAGPPSPTQAGAPAADDPTDLRWQQEKGGRATTGLARADDASGQPPAKKAKKPKPETKAKPPAEERRPAYRIPARRLFIKGDEAAAVLARAREAATDDQRAVEALDLYRQLRDSDRAREAAPEELRLLAANDEPDEALRYAQALPPELTSDATRLEHARLLRAAGKRDEAVAVAGSIARTSAEADPAALLVAACLRDADRIAEARRLYQHVAAGGGPHATEAAAELAALPAK